MDTSMILLGVALVMLIYIIFFYATGTDNISARMDLAQSQTPIDSSKLTKPESAKYSYELWLYVYGTKENAGTNVYLFSREGTDSTSVAPLKNIGLKLNGTVPSLTLDYTTKATAIAAPAKASVLITDNLPLQSWVHVIVSVDNSFIDIYMNGKLVKSVKDATIATPSVDAPINFENSKTYLAKFSRTIMPTDPQTAWNNYLAGNGENPMKKLVGNYGLSLAFTKDNLNAYNLNILGGQ